VDAILGRQSLNALCPNGRFSGCGAPCEIMHLRQLPCCERAQRKNRMHSLGSDLPFAAFAHKFSAEAGSERQHSGTFGSLVKFNPKSAFSLNHQKTVVFGIYSTLGGIGQLAFLFSLSSSGALHSIFE
jgi:hypothetical protein